MLPNDRPHRHTEMEFSVSATDGLACFLEVRQLLQKDFPDVVWPVDIGCSAKIDLMSNASERETVTISVHQDVRLDESDYYAACERIFRSFGGRPHWGKVNYFDGWISNRLTRNGQIVLPVIDWTQAVSFERVPRSIRP